MTNKTTNPRIYLELLEVFRLGLIHGIIDKVEAVAWADQIIESDAEPDYFIIELSLSGNTNEMLAVLNAYIDENKTLISARVMLGLVYKQLFAQQIDLKKAIIVVDWLTWKSELHKKDKRLLYRLDEHYEMEGVVTAGSMNDVRVYTLEVLEMYRSFTLDNFKDWKKINAEVDRLVDGFDGFLY